MDGDYAKRKNKLQCDEIIVKAITNGHGIRLLKQQPWETLVSFIISTNNNIPRIKKIIELLCENFGDKLIHSNKIYYSFPTAETLAELNVTDLAVIRCGYRDKFIIDAAKKVASGEINLQKISNMSLEQGRSELKKVTGVGDKVAECVLLFAYQKYDAFPKDVWVKRVFDRLYSVDEEDIDSFVRDKFGDLCGLAQQYLFYYGRQLL
jgi:N-glycosylase/DNA lyase